VAVRGARAAGGQAADHRVFGRKYAFEPRATKEIESVTPLTLRPNIDSASAELRTDHYVMSGELRVGRIYKREASKPELRWLWAINGVQLTGPEVMRVAGTTATFEEAEAQLKENWDKWLAWAKLQEISGATPHPAPPRGAPPATPGSST
jgi:hypothetical protein